MSNILTFKVEDDLSPPKFIFPSHKIDCYRASFSGPVQGQFYTKQNFLQNFLMAYHNDLPIYLSPDDIWLLICQGFSQHVTINSRQLRDHFVDFEGQQTITVERYNMDPFSATVDDWRDIISEFPEHLKKQVKGDICDVLDFNFSTTSLDTKISGYVTLMSALKEYFKYHVIMYCCGIPYIQLDGTLEDWERVLDKTNKLRKYDLDWWIDELVPVLQQFIRAKKGDIDVEFWKNMIKEKQGRTYDPGFISGWIVKFFPYDVSNTRLNLNKIDTDQARNLFPQILDAPFILRLEPSGQEFKCTFHSGFIGVTQDPKTYVVKQRIGWYITFDDEKKE